MMLFDRRDLMVSAGALYALSATPALAKENPMSRLYAVQLAILAAWRTQDVEGVLTHVTDDIVWRNSSEFASPIVGKPAMRAALNVMGPKIKTSRWRIFDYAETADRLFVEGVDEFWTHDGAHVAIPYAGTLHFRGQQIYDWREYFDGHLGAEQRAGGGVSKWLENFIDKPATL